MALQIDASYIRAAPGPDGAGWIAAIGLQGGRASKNAHPCPRLRDRLQPPEGLAATSIPRLDRNRHGRARMCMTSSDGIHRIDESRSHAGLPSLRGLMPPEIATPHQLYRRFRRVGTGFSAVAAIHPLAPCRPPAQRVAAVAARGRRSLAASSAHRSARKTLRCAAARPTNASR